MINTESPKNKTYMNIIEHIIKLIVTGELKHGNKLPGERTLAEQLSTSRASIREAFRTLEILGIIEVQHGGGTYVRDFQIAPFINTIAPIFLHNVDIMGDMMDFRIMLEVGAVKVAAKYGDTQTLKKIAHTFKDIDSAAPLSSEQADIDFHMSIFAATNNRVFALAGECLSCILHTSIHTNWTTLMKDSAITAQWHEEHKAVYTAIKNRQPEQAADAIRTHLQGVRQYILKPTL